MFRVESSGFGVWGFCLGIGFADFPEVDEAFIL